MNAVSRARRGSFASSSTTPEEVCNALGFQETDMRVPMGSSAGMPCQEFMELVTTYLDGALSMGERARYDEHLRTCAGCRAYLAQMELVVSALGELRRGERIGILR
jgi:Putative zinc-finger